MENGWAFGQIHHALIKRLWKRGVYAHLLDWGHQFKPGEIDLLKSKFDTFVTTPDGALGIHNQGVPLDRLVVVAHHEIDLCKLAHHGHAGIFAHLKGFGAVSVSLVDAARGYGISRTPKVVLNGIDFDHFYSPVPMQLKSVGYAGAFKAPMSDSTDFKRGYLLPRVIDGLELEFKKHTFMNHLCMPGYYRSVESILITSKYESAGLPSMEAAAAGRLVIGAAAGYFDGSSGILCRTPDDEFVEDARLALTSHKDPSVYRQTCERAQQYARDHYDWEHRVDAWIELILG